MNGDIKRNIVWLNKLKHDLKNIIAYIKNDSPQNAQKVKVEILKKISALSIHPEIHSPDRFKLLNTDNRFRAFELHKIRIAYFVDEIQIMIIRVRHVKQEPLFY